MSNEEFSEGPDLTADGDDPQEGLSFETFVLSMGASALVHLGQTPNPETGERAAHRAMAQQSIDLLAMLEIKTRGNLTDGERRVLQATLYDLRMRFIEVYRSGGN